MFVGAEVMLVARGDARPVSRLITPNLATVAMSAAMLGGAAVLFLVVLALPAPEVGRALPWWVLIPLFVAGDKFMVNLRVGRSAISYSLGHVVLAVGLCLVPPAEVVVAAVAGAVGTQLLFLRQRGLKLAFNMGLWSLDATVAATCYGILAGGAQSDSVRSLAAVLVAVIVTNQVTALALVAVISVHEGFDGTSLRESLTWNTVGAVGNVSVAALAVVLIERNLAAAPFLGAVLVVLVVAHRAYEQLHDAHARLERHHGVAQSLAQAQGTVAVVDAVLAQARELLEVERAELHLGDAVAPHSDPIAGTDVWLRVTREHGGPVLLARDGHDAQLRDVLTAAAVTEAAVAPLPVSGRSGVLVVADRLGEVSTLDRGDLRTLETLANQAGVALDNAMLLDRLREDAARRAREALQDALTGLPNRRAFQETLDAALATGVPAGVVLLDLERFQDVNDALGHVVGDEVLVEVGHRLVGAVGPGGVVARLGSDQYALLVADTAAPHTVVDLAVAAARAVAQPLTAYGIDIELAASLGSATAPVDGADSTVLLQRAEVAMFRAKHSRTGHEPYVASLDGSSAGRLALYGELRRAVTDGQLEVHFQPAVHPASGAVVAAEALVRWRHPVRGLIPPDAFIPLAERSGLIVALTDVVLHRSFAELARWRAAGLLDRVAVNLSPRVLLDVALPARVERMLRDAGLPATAVTLEVTESAVMSDPERALAVLGALRGLGLHLSIDDYGTGYSSLSYITQLPVHEVKIDRSFVTGMAASTTGTAQATIVRSTVEMAHALGLSVVAEGVEDAATLELLAGWDCDSAQGYFMSRPLPVEGMDRWLFAHAGETIRRTAPSPRQPGVPVTRSG